MKQREECRLVSIGDLVADLNVPVQSMPLHPGQHQVIEDIRFDPGGAGIFLIAGAHLGAQMTPLGAVGEDLYGGEMIRIFKDKRINTDNIVQQKEGTTTLVIVLADGRGNHVFLGQIGQGPDVHFSEDWKNAIREADAVHGFGYTLSESRLADTFLKAMAFAQAEKKPVYFDPGPSVKDVPVEVRQQALSCCSVLLLTEEEIPLMLPGARGLPDAEKLLSETLKLVVVKLGAKGCMAVTHNERIAHQGYTVDVVDATGAGDSFAAAFILASTQGYPLKDALAIANAMGAAKVQKFGSGRQMPTLDEVRKLLDSNIDF